MTPAALGLRCRRHDPSPVPVTLRPSDAPSTRLPRWLHDGARVQTEYRRRTYTLHALPGGRWALVVGRLRYEATTDQVVRRCRPSQEGGEDA